MRVATPIAVVVAAFLVLAFLELPGTLAWSSFADLGHVPLFGVIALAVLWALPTSGAGGRGPTSGNVWLALGITLCFALASELIQAGTNRNADLGDFFRDGVGAVSFLCFAATHRRPRISRPWYRQRWVQRTGAVVLVMLAAVPTLEVAWAYRSRARAFPTLFEPGAAWTRHFVSTRHAAIEITRNPAPRGTRRHAARLTFHPAEFAAFIVEEPFPEWAGYQTLHLELFSELEKVVVMHVRIHDRNHSGHYEDRFHRTLRVRPGANPISVSLAELEAAPRSRKLDLSAISGLSLFAADPAHPFSLFLIDIRLEAE